MNPQKSEKVSRAVGAAFYPRRSRFREEKSVLFFLFSKKMFSFGRFVFVFLCFCVFVFAFVFVFVFVFFVFLCFLGVPTARLKGPTQRARKKARRVGWRGP